MADARRRSRPTVKWFGNAGHFICSHWCRFHLTTQVGPWLVSTVGEYWPERPAREMHARVYDAAWLAENHHLKGDHFDSAYLNRFGFQEIGSGRTYETMVFCAGNPCARTDCGCGLPEIDGSQLDFRGYTDAGAATRGHMAMLKKWSRKKVIA